MVFAFNSSGRVRRLLETGRQPRNGVAGLDLRV
jgi:hypothetical protein